MAIFTQPLDGRRRSKPPQVVLNQDIMCTIYHKRRKLPRKSVKKNKSNNRALI
jgi:hypothetical protein